jgi:superfamily I DNA/RNA helicase
MLTNEQTKIINIQNVDKKIIVIEAFAGTGKTSTMFEFIKKHNDKNILYLTFNSGLSSDTHGKFGNIHNVDIMTVHALAHKYLISNSFLDPNKTKVGKLENNYLIEHFRLESLTHKQIIRKCNYIRNKIECFCSISEKEHIVDRDIASIWSEMVHGKCNQVTHDMYLKWFQLMNVKLDYDIIILDEAQDSTPCVISLVMSQKCTRVMIGDIHQQIYRFRGVENPFKAIKHLKHERYTLTTSFRYGKKLACITNIFLHTFKDESNDITSLNNNTQIKLASIGIQNLEKGVVILSRTNFKLFENLLICLFNSKKIFVINRTFKCEKESNIVQDFINIENGKTALVKSKKLRGFNNIQDLKEFFFDIDNSKWKLRLKLYELYGGVLRHHWLHLQQQLVDTMNDADCILSTVHQTKGMEFDDVFLSDDFSKFKYDDVGNIRNLCWDLDNYNLMYVALTRAKHNVYITADMHNFLKWYFKFETKYDFSFTDLLTH